MIGDRSYDVEGAKKAGVESVGVTYGYGSMEELKAAGLPCVIVANEPHEIATAKYLEGLGGAVFAGYYSQLDESRFQLDRLDIAQMSKCAAQKLSLHGRETVYRELKELEDAILNNFEVNALS